MNNKKNTLSEHDKNLIKKAFDLVAELRCKMENKEAKNMFTIIFDGAYFGFDEKTKKVIFYE